MHRQHPSGGQPERLVYERALPAVPVAVGRMRHEADAALAALDVPKLRRHDVALVLSEAAANVVVHAYADAPPGLLFTLLSLSGGDLVLDVFDRGRGMVPHADSPGLGVGLALMAQLSDGLDIVPVAVGRMRHEADAALARLDVPKLRRHDVALVLSEAAANVVVHAYADAPPGLLFTLLSLSGGDLVLDVFDRGRGMVPHADSPGLGVGLALMAQLSDGLDIVPVAAGGLRVTAVFRGGTEADAVPRPAGPSDAERVQDYVEALSAATGADGRSLRAEAEAAITHAGSLRAERLG